MGLFQIVTDRSGGGMGNDDISKRTKDMYAFMLKTHETATNKVFIKIKNSTKFTLSHSAKDVIYETRNFIDRNADCMSPSLNEFLQTCCDPTIQKIYQMKTGFEPIEEEPLDPKDKKRQSSTPKTIWGKFSI